ncbi:hypothetical protein Hanom_Chr03g00240711 [Helianthus anomalus]
MFTLFCRRCPLTYKLRSFVFSVSISCTLCPLGQTQLDFFYSLRPIKSVLFRQG